MDRLFGVTSWAENDAEILYIQMRMLESVRLVTTAF